MSGDRAPFQRQPVWDWKDRPEKDRQRTVALRSRERRQATVRFVVGGLIAATLWWFGHPKVAAVALGVGLVLLVAALLAPTLSRRLEHALDRLVGWVTTALSFVLVGVLLYAVLTPLGLALRAGGKLRISLARPAPSAGSTSNWRDIPAVATDSYRRLF